MTRQYRHSLAWPAWLGLMVAGCGAAQGYTHLVLTDPNLGGMKYGVATFPAGWKAQGSISRVRCLMLGGTAGGAPVPQLQAQSADGQMQMRVPPTAIWQWNFTTLGNGRKMPQYHAPGCLPIYGPVSAAQFVRLYAQHMPGVSIVGPASFLPKAAAMIAQTKENLIRARQSYERQHPGAYLPPPQTFDAAAIRVESVSHGERRNGFLSAGVLCSNLSPAPTPNVRTRTGNCVASMTYLVAPPGKLMQMRRLLASMPPLQIDHHYLAAWKSENAREWERADQIQRQHIQQQQAFGQMMNRNYAQEQANANANHQAFMQQQATQYQNHEAFLGQMQSSTQSSMNNANAAMNARSTAASDWEDYARDQQTVRGSNGTQKVSSAYSNTWSNGWGGTAQSNDPNANPNGVVKGNWTRDKKVHGNGQPY